MTGDENETDDLPLDFGSERDVRRQRRQAGKIAKANKAWWLAALNDPVGRRVLWGLLRESHAFDTRFACGPNGTPQPEATWFHAGEQQFGLRLYQTWLVMDPAAVALMHAEHDPRFVRPASRDDEP